MEKTVLPENFDGTFRFTNPTDEDFPFQWNGKIYTFPKMSTSPMIILDATPVEVQSIRKKAAKKLAEREFFKSEKYKRLTSIEKANNAPALNSIMGANAYSIDDLSPVIQQCLEELPLTRASVVEAPKENTEEKLSLNRKGKPNTRVVGEGESLIEEARNTGN